MHGNTFSNEKKKTDLQCALSKILANLHAVQYQNERKLIYNTFWFEKKKFDDVPEFSHPLIFQRLLQQILESSQWRGIFYFSA